MSRSMPVLPISHPYNASLEVANMPTRLWIAALLTLTLGVAGCSSNSKSTDKDYRPLGDPKALNRGN